MCYQCNKPNCSQVFESKTLLRKHISDVHTIWYKCDKCPSKFKCKYRLEKHLRCHKMKTQRPI